MEEWLDIDDSDAIQNIRKKLPEELIGLITDEEIEEVIDGVYDFFLENGFLEEESNEIVKLDENEIFKHVSQRLNKKTKEKRSESHIKVMINAELDYSDFL